MFLVVPRSDLRFEQPFLACPIRCVSKIARHKKSGARKKFVHPCLTLHFGLATPLIMLNINKIESAAISVLSSIITLTIFAIHIKTCVFLINQINGSFTLIIQNLLYLLSRVNIIKRVQICFRSSFNFILNASSFTALHTNVSSSSQRRVVIGFNDPFCILLFKI